MAFRGPDRRLRTRYRVRVPFLLRTDDVERTAGFTRNISLLGISGYARCPIAQLQAVQCLLEIPEAKRPLRAEGTVIRCELLPNAHPDGPYEVGVFFKSFPGRSEQTLSRFLERVAAEEQSAIRTGYQALKRRLAARKRRKRLEALRKKRRKGRRGRPRKSAAAKNRKRAPRPTRKPRKRTRRRSTAA